MPILEYACKVWNPKAKNLSDILEKAQKFAVRFVLNNCNRNVSVPAAQKSLGYGSHFRNAGMYLGLNCSIICPFQNRH